MSVHSNRSSVSRRPVGGQVNPTAGQPSSPVPSHVSRSPSVSSEPIPYDIWVGPDIPFRPANQVQAIRPPGPPPSNNPPAAAVQHDQAMATIMSSPQVVENIPAPVNLQSPGHELHGPVAGDSNVQPWETAPHVAPQDFNTGHSTLEVVPEAYFDNFWSPEPKATQGPPSNVQNQPPSNVSSTGWAVASPPSFPPQSSEHMANIQNQPQSNVSSTGWAVASPPPLQSQPQPEHTNIQQPRPQSTVSSTVSSTGWAVATPEPSPSQAPSQPAVHSQPQPQPRPQSTVSSTGWNHPPFQNQGQTQQYPRQDDLSPLSMPGMAPSPMPAPIFSGPASSTASSPMTSQSMPGMVPSRNASVATNAPSLKANTPSRMPSNARPPVLNYNQPRSIESVSFASCCCQCSNAILYNTYYYNCTYCKLDICGTCFQDGQHPWTHLPSMVRLNAQETKAGDRRQDKQCQSCKSMKHRRMDCDECPYSVCLSCYSNAAVPTHHHKSFKLKATPGLTLSVRRGDGSPCCTKSSFGHCGRCYAPWKPEEWMVQCKTCLFEFEEVVALCLQCDTEILSACRQSQHQLVSMKCRQKLRSEQGAQQASVECTECAIQFQSMTDISFLRHPHSNYDFLFFTEDREQLFAAVYRSCKKKSPRTDTPLPPSATTTQCTYCHHNVPTEILHSCLPCANVKYCPHCYPIAAPTHHHGPPTFVSHRDILQTQLGGGWTQRKNSAGRIWYHHTRTNTRSFEFPQSAIGAAPEPVSAAPNQGLNLNQGPPQNSNSAPTKPTNPRRATTGGIPTQTRPNGPLPPGWEARKRPDGRRYYANTLTKETSWTRPASLPRPARPGRNASVPAGGVQWEQDAAQPVTRLTAEQKAAAKEEAKKKAQRNKIYTKIGTSVLKGVVSGVIS